MRTKKERSEMNDVSRLPVIDIEAVKSRILVVRDQQILLDRDAANLYAVTTREINQAVRNNPDKFPEGFVFQLDADEFANWKSKILTSNLPPKEIAALKMSLRKAPRAFTERGLYMLATILKGPVATKATLAIVSTYAQVRSLKRDLLALNKPETQNKDSLMHRFGETLLGVVMPDPDVNETEASLELNFLIGKVKYTVRRVRKNGFKK